MSNERQRDRQVGWPFFEVLVERRRCLILTVSRFVLCELPPIRRRSWTSRPCPLAAAYWRHCGLTRRVIGVPRALSERKSRMRRWMLAKVVQFLVAGR